ncbi:MAG: GTPase HflX [Eubacteriales bacterium]|nr:GTPase HflX [Eubacteriales bacterium]
MEEIKEAKERVVLVGVHTGALNPLEDTTEESMEELALLVETAGGEVVGEFVQNRPGIDKGTFVGDGKLIEIRDFCQMNDVDALIFDDELTGAQIRNIEREVKIKVTDRSALILDIFAQRALTREGKIQVELAQLKYMLPRLTGSSANLSRLGGGIGTRGPGETKLESDRRHIRGRILTLSQRLEEVVKNREIQRHARKKENIPQISIIGYTNAGKSTLLNYLTDAGVLAEDKLFATLDPTARKLTLEDGTELILVDTVGFIRKLPHHLIKAFRSTLEEAALADVLLHVVDSSSSYCCEQIEVTKKLLDELGAGSKPVVTVFNKADIADTSVPMPPVENAVYISAKTGKNVDKMLEIIKKILPETKMNLRVLIPYDKGALLAPIYANAVVKGEEHTEDGTLLEIIIDKKLFSIVEGYVL